MKKYLSNLAVALVTFVGMTLTSYGALSHGTYTAQNPELPQNEFIITLNLQDAPQSMKDVSGLTCKFSSHDTYMRGASENPDSPDWLSVHYTDVNSHPDPLMKDGIQGTEERQGTLELTKDQMVLTSLPLPDSSKSHVKNYLEELFSQWRVKCTSDDQSASLILMGISSLNENPNENPTGTWYWTENKRKKS